MPPPRKLKRSKDFKRFAFTLAETLITLTIIGIIAAMTVPNIINNANQHAYISKYRKTYSVLKNAFLRNLDGTTKKPGDKENSAAPNITGQFGLKYSYGIEGAFAKDGTANAEQAGGKEYSGQGITFNANRSSSVYQDGVDEVRPYNLAFLICRKD